MNRDKLDAWFAQANDVLTDWHGSFDAMHGHPPTTDDVGAMGGDSYYEQQLNIDSRQMQLIGQAFRDAAVALGRAMQQMAEGLRTFTEQYRRYVEQTQKPQTVSATLPDDWRAVIEARRSRNTGPALPRLDGRRP